MSTAEKDYWPGKIVFWLIQRYSIWDRKTIGDPASGDGQASSLVRTTSGALGRKRTQGLKDKQASNEMLPPCELLPYLQTFKLRTFRDANVCFISVRHEWNCSLPSISYGWRSFNSTISHLLSLLQSVTLLPFHSMPDPQGQLLYWTTFQGTVL